MNVKFRMFLFAVAKGVQRNFFGHPEPDGHRLDRFYSLSRRACSGTGGPCSF